MRKKILSVVLAVCMISLTACAGAKPGAEAPTGAAAEKKEENTEKAYESKDGWKISYDADAFELNEDTPGETTFVYKKGSAGSNLITISYHIGKMPSEVLYEKVGGVDDKYVERSEGYFANTYPDWSYTRTVKADEGSGLNETFVGIEHNGGTVIIEVLTHDEKDDDKNMSISDDISAVLDSFTFTNHKPQEEYAYVPGTYTHEFKEEIEGKEMDFKDTIILNADHSGKVEFQDSIDVIWSSYEIIQPGNNQRNEYTVEGDYLYYNNDGEFIEFHKEK